jgi:hypothetical protein
MSAEPKRACVPECGYAGLVTPVGHGAPGDRVQFVGEHQFQARVAFGRNVSKSGQALQD